MGTLRPAHCRQPTANYVIRETPATSLPASREQAPTSESNPGLSLLDRIQPVALILAIGVGLSLARVAPSIADSLLPLVSIGVFALIFLVMLGLEVRSVAQAFGHRRFLAIAVVINFVINPLLAWGLGAVFLRSEADLWVGLILFLVTPCIGWYLVFTELAGGDTGLGVSLLAINIVLQVLLLPLYLWAFVGQVTSIDPVAITNSIIVFLLLPLALAALALTALARTDHSVAQLQHEIRLPYVKLGVLVMVIVAMFGSHASLLFDNPRVLISLIPPMTAFFAIAFAVALLAGRAARLPYSQVAALAFTTTSRNSEASLAIAVSAFTSPLVAMTVVVGPVIELPLLVIMIRILIGLRRKRPHAFELSRSLTGIDPRSETAATSVS